MYRFKLVSCCAALWIAAASLMAFAPGVTAATQPRSTVKASKTSKAFSTVPNPARNAVPSPDYNVPCWNGGAPGAPTTTACHTAELAAINHQHAVEHVAAITLPRTFWSLTPALQTFVITNLERVSRGLKPVIGVNAQISGWASTAARNSSDVSVGSWDLSNGTQLQVFGSVWAADLSSLDADFIWMYVDGWATGGSMNADCTSPTSTGCWGHRQIMLGSYGGSAALVAGVASMPHSLAGGDLNSDAEGIASYTGVKPTLTYTWATAVAAGAR